MIPRSALNVLDVGDGIVEGEFRLQVLGTVDRRVGRTTIERVVADGEGAEAGGDAPGSAAAARGAAPGGRAFFALGLPPQ